MGFSTSQMRYLNLLSSGENNHRRTIQIIGEMTNTICELRWELFYSKREVRQLKKEIEELKKKDEE